MTTKTATKQLSAIDAQKIVDQLESKAAELAASCAADERELASISFEAHASEDQKALARLETIKARAVKRELDAKSLDAAVAEAKRRVAEAQAEEAKAEQKRCAGEARVIVDRIDSLFASADLHFKQAMDALVAADKRIAELHQLGFQYPTSVQLRANIMYALETCLMALPKYLCDELARSGVRFLAPHQRRTFSQFWSQMSANLGREIANRLGEKPNKEVA